MQENQSAYYKQIKPDELINLFWDFIEQRPNLEPGNYSDYKEYRNEQARITRQLHNARKALGKITRCILHDNGKLNPDALKYAFRSSSGRLSLVKNPAGKFELEYITGQYWPTEYRLAACEVLKTYCRLVN